MSSPERLEIPLQTLAASLRGALVRPHDPEWDRARTPWNLTVDQQPAAVVFPQDDDDLRLILDTARTQGLGVTVQPRGHGASGDLSDCILIRPQAFDEVEIFEDDRYARVGAGVLWGTLLAKLDGTGLVALPGSSPDVSVAGYLLSGGHSWFSRWKGLAANSIRAIEFVNAAGVSRRLRADDTVVGDDADLLWALRGAGGLFGIVTTLEIDLYPAPSLFGGKLTFPGDAAETVFAHARKVIDAAPDELSMFLGMINMPDLPMVPELMRGQIFATIDVVFVGDPADGAAFLKPILDSTPVLLNQTRPFTISQLGEVAAEPEDPIPLVDWSATISEIDQDGLDALVAAFRAATPAGLTMLQLRRLGGAVAEMGADAHGVVGHLDAEYLAFAVAIPLHPDRPFDAQAVFGPLDAVLDGNREKRTVPSMLPHGVGLSGAYPPETISRLARIKRAVDPDNILRSNRPLVDAAVGT